ncbi:MAG: sulfurtransferase complex subunit TusB [Gammaproteobacteria bacterium]|nr:sulfurtransferase complex subunit TusB [Gammaproteobacteria bacterium]
MSLLHTINKSPFERNALQSCLRLAEDGHAVLLIEDAVVAALDGTEHAETIKNATGRLSVYVLGPDLDARGLPKDRIIDGIEVVDYDRFVALTCEHDSVQSWL